jgi:hypothetical protein
MRNALDQILLEAGVLAANPQSEPHRLAAARELAGIDIYDLSNGGQAVAHIALALRQAVIGMALLADTAARASAADGLRAFVAAIRTEQSSARKISTVEAADLSRRYWIDR